MREVYGRVRARFRDPATVEAIYTLANEGGHADHDAAHAIAAMLARSLGCLDRAFQVPVYRSADGGRPWFVLFAPLTENGAVRAETV